MGAMLAVPASAWAVDVFIRGEVAGRVPAKNLGLVVATWDYQCLGGKLGAATYEWTLKAVRREPKPEVTVVLAHGTAQTGSVATELRPGRWQLVADPFSCQTERGAGWAQPELGATVTVPDYCSWLVTRGSASVERAGAVRALPPAAAARPGDVVVALAREVTLRSRGDASTIAVAARARVGIERRHCGRTGGWRLEVSRGAVVVRAAGTPRLPYLVVTRHAIVSGASGRWSVTVAAKTAVRVLAGKALVQPRAGGKPVSLGAGRRIVLP